MLLQRVEDVQKHLERLEEKHQVTVTELAVLKTKIAFIAIIATLIASPLVSWILRKIGI